MAEKCGDEPYTYRCIGTQSPFIFAICFRGGQHFFSDEYLLFLFGEESVPKEVVSSKKESNPVETFVLSLGVGP